MNLTVPVVGILRGVGSAFFKSVMETSFVSGLQAIEITMNTDMTDTANFKVADIGLADWGRKEINIADRISTTNRNL